MAEGGGLLNRYRVVKPYRGFESLRLRQLYATACPAIRSSRAARRTASCGHVVPGSPQALFEVRHRAAFFGNCPETEEKARRPVIARSVAALDFGLDVTPDAFTSPCYCIESDAAGFLGLFHLSFSFGGELLGRRLLAGEADRMGAGAELAYGPGDNRWGVSLDRHTVPDLGSQLGRDVGVAVV